MFLGESPVELLESTDRLTIGKKQYFWIFRTIVWAMKNLNISLDRARRVLLGTSDGIVGTSR